MTRQPTQMSVQSFIRETRPAAGEISELPVTGKGITPQDLASLVEIADRVGGIGQLQDFLKALDSIR